jgi:uncharacterized membrane protein YdbT with pleckstrin-like domain
MGKPRYLNADENVVLVRHPHVKQLFGPGLVLLVVGVAAVLGAQMINPGNGLRNGWINWAAVIAPLLAALFFLWKWLAWNRDQLVLTSQRLISRTGFVAKSTMEIPLDRINNISCTQSVGERVTGSGDLIVESGGESGRAVFANMSKPVDIQREIYRQIERNQARDMDRMAGSRPLSIPEQIEKLDDLRQRGVINQAEFDAKKQQLLDQL